MYFKMTNILFSVMTNALGFGVTLTNKSLLSSYNACINIISLPFISVLLGPCSYVLMARTASWLFIASAMSRYMVYAKTLSMLKTKAVALLLMGS